MSTSLYWKPVVKEEKYLGYRLKFYISESLWGHDGSLISEWTVIDKNSINLEYLKGVRDTTDDKNLKKEIDELIRLLNKYGEIEVSLIN